MTDLSLANSAQPEPTKEQLFEQLKASLRGLARRISARRCLTADLDKLPDHLLRDVGLSRNDVASLRKVSLSRDGFGQLARRVRERDADLAEW